MKPYSGDSYDDRFDSVMSYVEVRLKSSGTRLRVRDKDDLRTLFERLDQNRRGKGKNAPRFTNDFIEKAISTDAARKRFGTVVGRFGAIKELRRAESSKDIAVRNRLKSQGRASYRYKGGLAYKSSYQRGDKVIIRFRDANTGRFIGKNTNFEELD